MTDADLLDRIRSTPWIADLLAWFDFDITRTGNGPPEPIHLASGEPLEMIAGDAAGGAYLLVGAERAERPVLYADSEGRGGLVAVGLRNALALVVGLPSLSDATSRPYGEDGGAALRAWMAACDQEIRDDRPSLDADRARLRDALDLPVLADPLAALHAAAADQAYRPIHDGDMYDSLLD